MAVKTGKIANAGTDANVFIIIYGKNGRTTIHLLDNPGVNDFERNTTSEFTVRNFEEEFESILLVSLRLWIWMLEKLIESKFGTIIRALVLLGISNQ